MTNMTRVVEEAVRDIIGREGPVKHKKHILGGTVIWIEDKRSRYIIARSGLDSCCNYACVISLTDGNFWSEPIEVDNWWAIPEDRMSDLVNNKSWGFVKVKKGKGPYK